MAEHDEETKKKSESDDGKKKKKEPKKSKKEDGNDEINELTVEGKDKKKAKSKKEKSEAAPLDESKSPKPKKGKKLGSSDHEVKDDKVTDKKKKEDTEPGLDERADGETAQKSDAHAQTKAKKKKGVTAETSEDGNGQADNHGELPSKDATPVQTKTKTKKSKKIVPDEDSIPKSKDTEETVDGETTLKDAPSTQPKMKKRKSKKNIMAESSDDELEIKSDHVIRKKKGKKHDLTANDEETEAKTKVKKGEKKHKASELGGENAENTKKKKKKRSSENLEVADSLTDSATMEPSTQSNETTPIFSLPTTARALDDPAKEIPSEQSTKTDVVDDNTVGSGSHVVESRLANNEISPSEVPTIFEKERPDENQSFIAETEKAAGQVIGESSDNKGANDDPNSTQEVNEEQSPNKTPEDPSADIVVGDTMTVNDSIVAHHKGTAEEDVATASVAREATETKANFESHLAESAETDATSVEAIASGNTESTTGSEAGEVLSDVVPSLVTESDHPPIALAEESASDDGIKQEVPQPATELMISHEVKESQYHDSLQEGTELTSTQTAPVAEAANLEETSNQVESHVEARESETAVATADMDSLEVSSESHVVVETTCMLEGEPHENLGQDVAPKQVELDHQAKAISDNLTTETQEQSTEMEANMPFSNTSKSLGDNEMGPQESVVAEVQETDADDNEQVEESLVQANLDEVTEHVVDTVEIKETGDLEPTAEAPALEINNVTSSSESSIVTPESPNELLAVCEAMTGLVKNDESSSKEMNRLKEQILVLFSTMHEERIALLARLQKQEAELLKSEEKIEMLEDEMEKQLADWDVLEVKLGQAGLEIRKLLAENQRLGNEQEVVSKPDSNGNPSDFSGTKETKNFSDDIATTKSEMEEP